MKPYIGMPVWYWPNSSFSGTIIKGKPLAATVVCVHDSGCVNLVVRDHLGAESKVPGVSFGPWVSLGNRSCEPQRPSDEPLAWPDAKPLEWPEIRFAHADELDKPDDSVTKVADGCSLEQDLAAVLNSHSVENASNTPDFVLAKFLLGALDAYEGAVREREEHAATQSETIAAWRNRMGKSTVIKASTTANQIAAHKLRNIIERMHCTGDRWAWIRQTLTEVAEQLEAGALEAEQPAGDKATTIQLTPAEIQSGMDRIRWAEGLIRQLPESHDGRNSWLLNYGRDEKKAAIDLTPPPTPGKFRWDLSKVDSEQMLGELRRRGQLPVDHYRDAWQAVVSALDEVKPDWFQCAPSGPACAAAAIKDLAASRPGLTAVQARYLLDRAYHNATGKKTDEAIASKLWVIGAIIAASRGEGRHS